MTAPKIYPLCETAISIEWGNAIDESVHQQITSLNSLLQQRHFPGFIETVPAYITLTIYYQPELIVKENNEPFLFVKNYVENLLSDLSVECLQSENIISTPVCYDEEFGYDLEFIAAENNLLKEEIITIHQQKEYRVYMMGFLPGFAYMGEVDDIIATPRKQTPRAIVEEGSVGIAGKQTGIYPLSSPGGWQIIGRTPLCLFNIQKQDPFLFKTGDRVKFYSIPKEEFNLIKEQQKKIPSIDQKENAAGAVVIKPRIFSTIQDGGRFGFQSYGVPVSGAMDTQAFDIANGLAGNIKNAAAIECTMGGLMIQFKKNAAIAVTGGGAAFVNHQKIKMYQPLGVAKNDVLEIKYNNDGMRTYIAVSGGFAAPFVMNSRSCYARAGIGNSLKKEETVAFKNTAPVSTKQMLPGLHIPVYIGNCVIRIIDGPENDWMTTESVQQLFIQNFILTNQCDRMGYRLQSDPLTLENNNELLSTAVTKGTIQLTPGGQLIILMSDCQTTGGYPRVAQIAAVDLSVIAQLKPGDIIQFSKISFREAEELYLSQQKTINAFFS